MNIKISTEIKRNKIECTKAGYPFSITINITERLSQSAEKAKINE